MKRAVAVGVCALVVAGCASSSSSSTTSHDPTVTAAQELASLEPGDDPSQFQSVLVDLKPACREGPEKLASEIWASWQDLRKNNRPTTLLHVAQALDTVGSGLTPNAEPTNCASLLAAYPVTAEAPGGQP
jgi:hypothetical protein